MYYKKNDRYVGFRSIFGNTLLIFIVHVPFIDGVDIGHGHSSIALFQGSAKYELDAKDCPVGKIKLREVEPVFAD